MKYIIEVEVDKIEDIRNKFKVIWESDIINGLLIVEAECINDIVGIDGIKRVEESRMGGLFMGGERLLNLIMEIVLRF